MHRALIALCALAGIGYYEDNATDCGPTSPDGAVTVTCDLPVSQRLKNVGGSDGAGLCVFTSLNHSANWQNVEACKRIQAWMKSHKGGGDPDKVDKVIAAIAKELGVPKPQYVQYCGKDPAVLDLAIRNGQLAAITYGYSERYARGGESGYVDHMCNLPHLDNRWACVLDNNFVGENQLEWMSREELLRRWQVDGNGQKTNGWAVVFLDPGPIPVCQN